MSKGATVTLVRGRNYSVVHPADRRKGSYTFERGKPRFIDDEDVIRLCEELHEIITDSDDEEVEKPIFLVERGVGTPTASDSASRKRLTAGESRGRRTIRKI
jgi:hypothetical protein